MPDRKIENVVIHAVESTMNSFSGNPGYRFDTNIGSFRLLPDASFGYSVENYSNRQRTADDENNPWLIGNPSNPEVTLIVTGSNQVYGIEYRGKVLP